MSEATDMNDAQLLRNFAEHGSERKLKFTRLVATN
jgi:hypothetical protein